MGLSKSEFRRLVVQAPDEVYERLVKAEDRVDELQAENVELKWELKMGWGI